MKRAAERTQGVRDKTRIVARLSMNHFLRTLNLIAGLQGGDLLLSQVFLSIAVGNVDHIDRAGDGGDFEGLERAPPDALRRPVSVLNISRSLGLPYETTRRQVGRLLASGDVVRVSRGLIVPTRVIDKAEIKEALRINMSNLRQLLRRLEEVGVSLQ